MAHEPDLTTPRRWLVLPIESNIRELEARTLLAAVAAERGFASVIGRQSELPRYLPALPSAVVLQMNAISTHVFDLARRHSHLVTALDEEGLVVRDPQDYLRRRISVDALELCECFFAWGDAHRSGIVSKAPHLAEKIVSTGSPRLDLLRPELREVYRGEADAIAGRMGRFVLFDSNFGTFNHKLGPTHVAELWAASGWTEHERSRDVLARTMSFQQRLLDAFVSAIEALARVLPPDVGIVVRPHPAERQETWQERLSHVGAARVVREGGIVPWLLAASAVVHNSCTTGLESAVLGRPTFAYLATRDEVVESLLANEVSTQVETEEELIAGLVGSIDAGLATPRETVLARLAGDVSHLTGPLAGEAMLDEIDRFAPDEATFTAERALPLRIRSGRVILRVRSFASGIRRRNLAGERRLSAFVRNASPGISPAHVGGFLRAIAEASGRFEGVSASRLGPDLVVVTGPPSKHLARLRGSSRENDRDD